MTRSRLVVLASFSVVVLGVAGALGALLLDATRAAAGPLPTEGLILPADARVVMGVDVRSFTGSELYQQLKTRWPSRQLEMLRQLEEKTGLDPERDLEQVLIAGRQGSEGKPGARLDPVILLLGQLDPSKLGRAIETAKQGVSWKDVNGTNVYLFEESKRGQMAVAFLDERAVVLGTSQAVEAMITSHAAGAAPLESNANLMRLLERVEPGSAFWMVGDRNLLSQLPQTLPGPGGAGFSLPAVESLVVSGNVAPVLSVKLSAEAADEASATQLADVVRGLSALLALQASQRPELAGLASAISVTTEASHVHVNARLSEELIETLMTRAQAGSQEES